MADSVGALAELRSEGKIRHVGLSNVTVAQIAEASGIVPIVSVQNRYNLLERGDDPVVDYCAAHGIAYLPWGPLAAKPFAREAPLGSTPGALAWLLRRSPNIIAIPGTTSVQHLEENVAAAQDAIVRRGVRGCRRWRTERPRPLMAWPATYSPRLPSDASSSAISPAACDSPRLRASSTPSRSTAQGLVHTVELHHLLGRHQERRQVGRRVAPQASQVLDGRGCIPFVH